MRAALINEEGTVENVIELPEDYDPEVKGAYRPEQGFVLQLDVEARAEVGGKFENGKWVKPTMPNQEPPSPLSVQEQISIITNLLVEKGTLSEADVSVLKATQNET